MARGPGYRHQIEESNLRDSCTFAVGHPTACARETLTQAKGQA